MLSMLNTRTARPNMLVQIAVFEAYERNTHAFIKGCGRETLCYWVVSKTCAGRTLWSITPNYLRSVMDYLVQTGRFRKGKSNCGYTTFTKEN